MPRNPAKTMVLARSGHNGAPKPCKNHAGVRRILVWALGPCKNQGFRYILATTGPWNLAKTKVFATFWPQLGPGTVQKHNVFATGHNWALEPNKKQCFRHILATTGPWNLAKNNVFATFWPQLGPGTQQKHCFRHILATTGPWNLFFFQALSVRVKRTHAPRSPALATPATSMVRLWASISTDRRAEGPPSALAPPFGAVPGVQCQVPTPVLTHLGETATCSSLEHRGLRFVR